MADLWPELKTGILLSWMPATEPQHQVEDDVLAARRPATMDLSGYHTGYGRELFGWFRRSVSNPEQGASFFWNHEA